MRSGIKTVRRESFWQKKQRVRVRYSGRQWRQVWDKRTEGTIVTQRRTQSSLLYGSTSSRNITIGERNRVINENIMWKRVVKNTVKQINDDLLIFIDFWGHLAKTKMISHEIAFFLLVLRILDFEPNKRKNSIIWDKQAMKTINQLSVRRMKCQ